jgi:hypothetical protein
MSNRIRALRYLSHALPPDELKQLLYMATGQASNITADDMGGSPEDYLNGPSMASIMLKQAKGELLRDRLQQGRKDDDPTIAPMIASIIQLDRQ